MTTDVPTVPAYETWKPAIADGLRDRCSFCCSVVWTFRALYKCWRAAGGFTACGICYYGIAAEQEAERVRPERVRLPPASAMVRAIATTEPAKEHRS